MRIWIIDTGLQGVTNQGAGIARAIATIVPCEISVVRKTIRTKRLRWLANWAINLGLIGPTRPAMCSGVIEKLLYKGTRSASERPDIVITALARSEYAAILLGGKNGAFTIHIGKPLNFPPSHFNFIVLVNGGDAEAVDAPHVKLPIYPTPALRRDVENKIKPSLGGEKRRWAVFLGGNGAGYRYTPKMWDQIAGGLTQLAERFEARLLITTSRRTGIDAERRLSAAFPASIVEQSVWYGSDPKAVVSDFLAESELVFCTADSRSMMADAITAGRSVYAINQPDVAIDGVHERFLSTQERAHRLRTLDISRVGTLDVDADLRHYFKPLESCWSEELLNALQKTDFSRRFIKASLPRSTN